MKQAIVNFCKSMDTGLFLLDMPTGFGKTYSVLDFMVDNYDAPEFKDKKIFFVTTLKKNLPDKELREHFAKRGKADDYDKYCLRIEANADMVVEKLDELYRARKIPAAITMKQEFKDLHGSVKLLNEYRDKKRELKGTSKDIINVLCKNAEDAIRKQQEGAFRKVIESELKLDKCGGKRAVIINIMLDHNMQITSSDNGRIIEIPYLYRLDRKEIGTEIIAKINREGYLQ